MLKNSNFERNALIVLSLMLVSVFVLSVRMYDYIEEGTKEGALAVFAENVRDFLDNNEAIAVFLGTEKYDEEVNKSEIEAEAAAYIERYNSIYEKLK